MNGSRRCGVYIYFIVWYIPQRKILFNHKKNAIYKNMDVSIDYHTMKSETSII